MNESIIKISRKDLYELVWAEPVMQLAKRYGFSDVWLAKICRRHNIPRPPRGYWARKKSGQKVPRPPHSDKEVDYFPLPDDSELYRALKWQWEHRNKNSPFVFTDPDTGQKFIHRNKFMESLCKRAGVRPFGFKALRKFGPSVLNDIHRVSIKKLQRLLRHRTQTTTEIYLKKIDDDLSVGLRLLEKKDTHRDTHTKMGATLNS